MTTVLDAANISEVSAFWAGLLGGEVHADDDWHSIVVDGATPVAIQLAPDHIRPQWPDGQPQQLHIDLHVADIAAAHEEALALGATPLTELQDFSTPDGFQVYADPAGHPFCLCWG